MTTIRLAAFLFAGGLAGWFAAVVVLPCLCDVLGRIEARARARVEELTGGIEYGDIIDGPQEPRR